MATVKAIKTKTTGHAQMNGKRMGWIAAAGGVLLVCAAAKAGGSESTIVPEPMNLAVTTIASRPWNGAADSFGLWRSGEGPTIGPAAVAYGNGRIYLLDSVKNRLLEYGQSGDSVNVTAIPFDAPTDLVLAPDSSTLIVAGQRTGELCKIGPDKALARLPSVDMRHFTFPATFSFEAQSGTLYAREATAPDLLFPVLRGGRAIEAKKRTPVSAPGPVASVQGPFLIIALAGGAQTFRIDMGRPVFCVEETVLDGSGCVWARYTLEGDYRVRRFMRLDTGRGAAGVALTAIWFPFDAARRMAGMAHGVVVFAGDMTEGRILTITHADEDGQW